MGDEEAYREGKRFGEEVASNKILGEIEQRIQECRKSECKKRISIGIYKRKRGSDREAGKRRERIDRMVDMGRKVWRTILREGVWFGVKERQEYRKS